MFTDSIQKVRKSIFPIFFFGKNGTHGSLGTGFFIDTQGHFLTANHVIKALPEGGTLAYKIIAQDINSDLALGKIDSELLPPLQFAKEKAKIGQSIALCGYPLPHIKANPVTNNGATVGVNIDVTQVRQYWQPTMKMDRIRKNSFYNKPFDSFITQHPSLPGMSGGPIFDLKGNVVGVNTANATRQIQRSTSALKVENGIGIELSEVMNFLHKASSQVIAST